MAHVLFQAPIRSIEGKISKNTICRTKRFPVGGRYIEGPAELYFKQKRNYKRCPLSPNERIGVNRFQLAEKQRQLLMNDPDQVLRWRRRFEAQRSKPDPEATKCYHHFPSFVRAMIYKRLQTNADPASSTTDSALLEE